ncbi:MAG: DUF3124 domain-containing protein [Desulfobacterales bacterium]
MKFSNTDFKLQIRAIFAVLFLCGATLAHAGVEIQKSSGETVYVSVYSNVHSGPKAKPFQLAVMLSIRNTDPKNPITVLKVEYYNSSGEIIDRYITKQLELAPLASKHFYIKEYDERGGPGANFIVKWESSKKVNQPIIEGIMLGLASGQGLSFICPGQIIDDYEE